MKRHTLLFSSLSSLALVTSTAYALPFSITAKGTLPTTYTSSASYNITNTTSKTHHAFIRYLPPNVSIVSSGTTCATSLNTAFSLTSGGSCTLNLSVTGPVSSTDSNPDHHLMVCLSDNVTCAGPNPANSLNVPSATPSSGEYAFISTAQGSLSGAQGVGLYSCPISSNTLPNISACSEAPISPTMSVPTGVSFDATNNIVYAADYATGVINSCRVSSGTFGTCTGYTTNIGAGKIEATALGPNHSYIYASTSAPSVYACTVNASGVVGTSCTNTGATDLGTFALAGLTVNTVGNATYGYVATSSGDITLCTVTGTSWGSCTETATGFSFLGGGVSNAGGIVLNSTGQYAYIVDANGLWKCSVNSGTGALTCPVSATLPAGGSIPSGGAIAIDSTNSTLYITSGDTTYNCPIGSGGSLSTCTAGSAGSFPDALGIAIS